MVILFRGCIRGSEREREEGRANDRRGVWERYALLLIARLMVHCSMLVYEF